MNRHAFLTVLIAISSVAFAKPHDQATIKAALLKRDAEWSAAASAGKDVKKIVSFWSDDAEVIPPGQPAIKGRSALIAFVTTSLRTPGFHIEWKSRDVVLSPDGRMAYMHGVNRITVPGPDGKLMTLKGRGITIWRKGSDGRWLCTIDIWNEPPG